MVTTARLELTRILKHNQVVTVDVDAVMMRDEVILGSLLDWGRTNCYSGRGV